MTIETFLQEVRERLSKALQEYPDDAVLHDSKRLLRIVERQRNTLYLVSGCAAVCDRCVESVEKALAYDGTPRESGKEA